MIPSQQPMMLDTAMAFEQAIKKPKRDGGGAAGKKAGAVQVSNRELLLQSQLRVIDLGYFLGWHDVATNIVRSVVYSQYGYCWRLFCSEWDLSERVIEWIKDRYTFWI